MKNILKSCKIPKSFIFQKKSSQAKNAIERTICPVPWLLWNALCPLYICIYYRKYEQKYLREVQWNLSILNLIGTNFRFTQGSV
jgi:hypothetical protein